MLTEALRTEAFSELNKYVSEIQNRISASAAATYVIDHDHIVNEWTLPNPPGYDYLEDIQTFGNMVCKCVEVQS